jgi:polar amino acid transport system substrate-binding protein
VAFSLPWIQARQALLVPRGNPRNLQSYAAASASEVRVAFVAGATEEDLLRKSGLPAERLLAVPDALAGRIAVDSGAADALALSAPTIRLMERERDLGRTEAASQFEQPPREITAGMGLAAFAFRKEDRRLREAWNAELMKLRGSAEQKRLLLRFGFTGEEAAGASAPRTKR